jgi:Stage II sporulation protein M
VVTGAGYARLNLQPPHADAKVVSVNELVLVQGMQDTKRALRRWNEDPLHVLRPWFLLSLLIACALLLAVWAVAELTTPDSTLYFIPGFHAPADLEDYGHVLLRNSLVLALHAMACVAGFMAGSSLPLSASHRSGLSRWVHEKAGPLAIGFVVCATAFSLCTQAYVIGGTTASVAQQLGTSPGMLILALAPHALPELVALFLPLAAWIVASRNDDWQDLLAATFVTVAIAVPVLLASAAVETWVSPHLLSAIEG